MSFHRPLYLSGAECLRWHRVVRSWVVVCVDHTCRTVPNQFFQLRPLMACVDYPLISNPSIPPSMKNKFCLLPLRRFAGVDHVSIRSSKSISAWFHFVDYSDVLPVPVNSYLLFSSRAKNFIYYFRHILFRFILIFFRCSPFHDSVNLNYSMT